jgi:hypothetical protein
VVECLPRNPEALSSDTSTKKKKKKKKREREKGEKKSKRKILQKEKEKCFRLQRGNCYPMLSLLTFGSEQTGAPCSIGQLFWKASLGSEPVIQ